MITPLRATGDGTLPTLLDRLARDRARHPALRWVPFDGPGASWTYGELVRDVRRLAAGLQARGIGPGDRLVLLMDNGPDLVLSWAAVLTAGAVAVCLNTRSSADELGYYGRHAAPEAAIVAPEYAGELAAAMPGLRWIAVADGLPGGARPGPSGADSLRRLLADERDLRPPAVRPLDAASIQYTSGTTARPKAVVWTHANCLWAGQVGAAHQRLGPADVNLLHLPLFHTNALSYSLLSTWWAGATTVLQPKFSASRFWQVAAAHGCTWSSMVSFCLRALAGHDVVAGHNFRGWGNSYCIAPGQGPGGVPAIGWFGMTETVSHPVCGDPCQPDLPGSMGRPAPEYAVAVVAESGAESGAGSGAAVGPGEMGLLLVRGVPGVSLFGGYFGDAAATAAAYTEDGWLRTGDRVRRDPGGTLTFVERDKDVLKVGGENVGAPEIERVVLQARGVREAAVVGRPDRMLGEVPVAFVLLDGQRGDDDLGNGDLGNGGEAGVLREIEALCARLLPAFKRPREVRVVAELPRSTLDKVAKARLRGLLRDGDPAGG
ncbi:MAG TPA: AMP-binding protein [Pseudonocardiaceae bacterium]